MEDLESLDVAGSEDTTPFFIQEGRRKGYVKGSKKPLERLFMSWWTFDPYIGRDKAYGDPEVTGTRFFISIKFWRRDDSNLWDFPRTLRYFGWKL
jgi:hypothetical protein